MTKPTLEYILSGSSYLGFGQEKVTEDLSPFFSQVMTEFRSNTPQKFGMLFNALVEEKNGYNIHTYLKPHLDSIHADSGGLQMVTLGMESDDSKKELVYSRQAKHSTVGMCFDEIPVRTTSNVSVTNYTSKRFYPEDLKGCAEATGRNITKQIEHFNSVGSECKPYLIAQGNCYDTYCQWVDYAMGVIPEDMKKYVGGISLAATSFGSGELEEVEKAFIVPHLPYEFENVHVLGVGSMSRMLPMIMLIRSGLYDGKHISYDSTTHSSCVEKGKHYAMKDGILQPIEYEKHLSPKHFQMSADVKRCFGDIVDEELVREVFTHGAAHFREAGRINDFFKGKILSGMAGVLNFCKAIDDVVDPNTHPSKYVVNSLYLESLTNVKTKEDYKHWQHNFGRHLKSKRVQRVENNSLEDFFT